MTESSLDGCCRVVLLTSAKADLFTPALVAPVCISVDKAEVDLFR